MSESQTGGDPTARLERVIQDVVDAGGKAIADDRTAEIKATGQAQMRPKVEVIALEQIGLKAAPHPDSKLTEDELRMINAPRAPQTQKEPGQG
jgi:hypothetical protein